MVVGGVKIDCVGTSRSGRWVGGQGVVQVDLRRQDRQCELRVQAAVHWGGALRRHSGTFTLAPRRVYDSTKCGYDEIYGWAEAAEDWVAKNTWVE